MESNASYYESEPLDGDGESYEDAALGDVDDDAALGDIDDDAALGDVDDDADLGDVIYDAEAPGDNDAAADHGDADDAAPEAGGDDAAREAAVAAVVAAINAAPDGENDAGGDDSVSELEAWDQREEEKWTNLESELALLDSSATPTVCDFLRREIERRKATHRSNPEFIRCDTGSVRLTQKIFVDVHRAPQFNFVGKILGPKGCNARRVAMEANVKLAIQGRGSSKDKSKEEELLKQGSPEHEHLNDPLHVKIDSTAPPMRAWTNMQHAIDLITPLMTPDVEVVPRRAPAPHGRGYADAANGSDSYYHAPVAPSLSHHHAYGGMGARYPYAMRASAFGKLRGRARGRGGRPY